MSTATTYVPLIDLVTVNPFLGVGDPDFDRNLIVAANRWANRVHDSAGYPTWQVDAFGAWEVIRFYGGHTWRDVKTSEMQRYEHRYNPSDLRDLENWARGINRYADAGNMSYYTNALMTGETNVSVRGGNFIERLDRSFLDLPETELETADRISRGQRFKVGASNPFGIWTRAAHLAARARGYRCGYPNYEIGANRVHGVYCMTV